MPQLHIGLQAELSHSLPAPHSPGLTVHGVLQAELPTFVTLEIKGKELTIQACHSHVTCLGYMQEPTQGGGWGACSCAICAAHA
jgi:hypothetical protein